MNLYLGNYQNLSDLDSELGLKI